jgi:predicted metalloprotease with PDZ domain
MSCKGLSMNFTRNTNAANPRSASPRARVIGMLAALCALAAAALPLGAAPMAVAIPAPQDVPYPGVIQLHVDATALAHRVFRVRQTIPVAAAGSMTLLYPQWLPGNHSPTGPVDKLAGLVIRAVGGERLEWRRDPLDMHAFHVAVPDGVTALELQFEYVTPTDASQWRVVMTPDLLGLQWEKALLYPAGYYVRQIPVEASIQLPPAWQFATSLRGAQRSGDTVRFARTPLETLVDSPLFAGAHYRRVDLDADPKSPVRLNIFADAATELEATDEQLEMHRRVVREMTALYGSRHFREYDFLLAISDHFSGIGLEHHESSENGVGLGYFTDWSGTANVRDLLPHEMNHSWNGKFRRPADLWTPTYNVPMQSSLLWVYEGMTEYYGVVVAGRSGLWSPTLARDIVARYAANYDAGRAGRQWRNLQDTTQAPIVNYRGRTSYPSWQRGKDYYTEGLLVWLDVDTKIRELTRGRRSLDDFARAFFGVQDGRIDPLTYTFDDVVAGLNDVAPHDWAAMLRARLDGHGPGAPLAGFERGGWKLVYRDQASPSLKESESADGARDFLYSLGIRVKGDGRITEVYWDSVAFKAGLAPATTVLAVDGKTYTHARLIAALKAAKDDATRPIELLVRDFDTFRTVRLDYHGGLRYPTLERVANAPDMLSAILEPRVPPVARKR